jgi:hypothetical protein
MQSSLPESKYAVSHPDSSFLNVLRYGCDPVSRVLHGAAKLVVQFEQASQRRSAGEQ